MDIQCHGKVLVGEISLKSGASEVRIENKVILGKLSLYLGYDFWRP